MRSGSGDSGAAATSPAAPSSDTEAQLRSELASQRQLVAQLRAEAAAAAAAAAAAEGAARDAEREWQRELAVREAEVASLQGELAQRATPAKASMFCIREMSAAQCTLPITSFASRAVAE